MNLTVFGLGKLGAPLAALAASSGYRVFGYDQQVDTMAKIADGVAPVKETGLQELLDELAEPITVCPTGAIAAAHGDIIAVVVPTPSIEETGHFSATAVVAACEEIGHGIANRRDNPLVVIVSTVSPGTIEGEVIPALEEASGERAGHGFDVCYNPEFIALGSVLQDMKQPDMILVGESSGAAGDRLEAFWDRICVSPAPVHHMDYRSAEVAKIGLNAFLCTKLSYANMVGEICEKSQADADAVLSLIGDDSRVGHKFLRAGAPYGGPCLPRDTRALCAAAEGVGVQANIPIAAELVNLWQIDRIGHLVTEHYEPGGTVGILGLTYKPETSVVEESLGTKLIDWLTCYVIDGCRIKAHDPRAMPEISGLSGEQVVIAETPEDCLRGSSVCVLATEWREFEHIDPEAFSGVTVIDCWRMLPTECIARAKKYIPLGGTICTA